MRSARFYNTTERRVEVQAVSKTSAAVVAHQDFGVFENASPVTPGRIYDTCPTGQAASICWAAQPAFCEGRKPKPLISLSDYVPVVRNVVRQLIRFNRVESGLLKILAGFFLAPHRA